MELAAVPLVIVGARPGLLPGIALQVIAALPRYLWPGIIFLGGQAALATLARRCRIGRRGQWILHTILVVGVVGVAAWILMIYPPFRSYAPFYVLLIGLIGGLLVGGRPGASRPGQGWLLHVLDRLLRYLGIPAALVAHGINLVAFHGLYPTFHLALFHVTFVILGFAGWRLLADTRIPRLGPRATAWGLGCLALLAALGGLGEGRGWWQASTPYFRSFAILGQSRVIFHPFTGEEEGEAFVGEVAPDPEGVPRFLDHIALPELPEGFALADYNVLMITIEATRFDQTSLADPALATTPSLQRLAEEDGAFVFSRAYSPASGTLHSMSGLLAMSYPSMLELETWRRAWFGRLHDREPLISEHFKAAGYTTFWVGHNYKDCFTTSINGFLRGWDELRLISSLTTTPDNDLRITEIALDKLRRVAWDKQRFFGLIFLESPHSPYHAHEPGEPAETDLERYRQEIRFADRQIGRILDHLRARGRLDDTILIVVSDHGEEFREHGGVRHKSTVYSESIRVPLLIRIPGVDGEVIDDPVSTLYVFPWLFLSGPPALREPAIDRLEHAFGPMLRETEGAVVSELFGHDRMMSTLIYPDYKFNYDFIAGRYEVFAIEGDPLEQDDLFGRDPELTQRTIDQIDRYREVRRQRRRYILLPDRDEDGDEGGRP